MANKCLPNLLTLIFYIHSGLNSCRSADMHLSIYLSLYMFEKYGIVVVSNHLILF